MRRPRRGPRVAFVPLAGSALLALLIASRATAADIDWPAVRDEAARLLSGYIQIDTTNPPGGELPGALYLQAFFDSRGIDCRIFEPEPGRGNLVARLPATHPQPGGPGPILLLSHIDVVPADPEAWTFPPFSGAIRDGAVYGRGAVDDKGHGAAFAMAMALLAGSPEPRTRDVVFAATADEEVSGRLGAAWLIENHWQELGPPAVVWNEGGASAGIDLVAGKIVNGIATTEKRAVWLRLVAEGEGGHGSQPVRDGANERLLRALARIDSFETPLRVTPTVAEQFRRISDHMAFPERLVLRYLSAPPLLRLARGRLTADRLTNAMLRDTIAITGLRSGLKHNVIPRRAEADLDVRLLPDTDVASFILQLERVIDDPNVRIEDVPDSPVVSESPFDHELFEAIEAEMKRELPDSISVPLQASGGTDSLYFWLEGIPAYGFQASVYSAELTASVHGLDERMPVRELERSVRVTYRVLQRLTRK